MISDVQLKLQKINRLVELFQKAEQVPYVSDSSKKYFREVQDFLLAELEDTAADLRELLDAKFNED